MQSAMKFISYVALAATIVPVLLVYVGLMNSETMKWAALLGTIGWFVATPSWMGRELSVDAQEVEI